MVFVGAALIAAVLNWIAVGRRNKPLEYIAKPATTALLVLAAATSTTPQSDERAWVVAALLFCLAGDVFLMLPRDMFVPGLASFLVGHVLFMIGFAVHQPTHNVGPTLVIGVAAAPIVGLPVLAAVKRSHPELFWPVGLYAVVISMMFGLSGFTGSALAVGGAAVFMLSDRLLAHNKFIEPFAHAQLAIMTTYHAALFLLVLSLR